MKKLFIFDSNPGEVGKSRCVKAIFQSSNNRIKNGDRNGLQGLERL